MKIVLRDDQLRPGDMVLEVRPIKSGTGHTFYEVWRP